MRTLNRPMFRYGGPIKEGVMSGIREPKRGGGSMGNLVGSPLYPKTKGREHHGFVAALPWIGQGLMAAGRFAARPFGRWVTQQVPKFQRMTFKPGVTSSKLHKGYPGSSTKGTWEKGKMITRPEQTFEKNWLGKYFAGSPEAGLITGTGGKVAKGIYGFGKGMAKSPLTMGGLIWGGYQWLKPDGTPANENEIAQAKASTGAPPGGGDPGMQGTGEWFAEQAEKEALAKEQKDWNNRIKKYRDIMDIKGMNKQAAYKSLVDASKLIQESQDFKGDIKSGKLINQVIQAASKQFDKPVKTSDAINTLILQNELKKDLSAETDALDKLYKKGRIAVDQKALNPSKSDLVGAYAKAGVKGQALYDNAGKELSANRGQTFRGNLIANSDFKEILADLKKNPETKDADDVSIIATWTQGQLDSSEKNIPDGNYTVGSTIVTIQDKQVVDVN